MVKAWLLKKEVTDGCTFNIKELLAIATTEDEVKRLTSELQEEYEGSLITEEVDFPKKLTNEVFAINVHITDETTYSAETTVDIALTAGGAVEISRKHQSDYTEKLFVKQIPINTRLDL